MTTLRLSYEYGVVLCPVSADSSASEPTKMIFNLVLMLHSPSSSNYLLSETHLRPNQGFVLNGIDSWISREIDVRPKRRRNIASLLLVPTGRRPSRTGIVSANILSSIGTQVKMKSFFWRECLSAHSAVVWIVFHWTLINPVQFEDSP